MLGGRKLGFFGAALALLGLNCFFDESVQANVALLRIIFFILDLILLSHFFRMLHLLCLAWFFFLLRHCHLRNFRQQFEVLEVDGGLILLNKNSLPLGLQDGHKFLNLIDRAFLSLILINIRKRLKNGLHIGDLTIDRRIDFFLESVAVSPAYMAAYLIASQGELRPMSRSAYRLLIWY